MRAYLLIALIAALVTFGSTYLVLKLAHRFKIYPQIRARDVHTKPTPRLGGIAMMLGFVVAMGAAAMLGWFQSVFAEPGKVITILVCAVAITLLGFFDDLYDLDWTLKLAGQFLVAGLLAWQGVQIVSLPIAGLTIAAEVNGWPLERAWLSPPCGPWHHPPRLRGSPWPVLAPAASSPRWRL